MTQIFDDFKQQYPKVANAMGILGMTHREYREAYNREVLRWVHDPPRISTSGSTSTLTFPGQTRYSNSTTPKE